jgi:hypothetical protein
MENKMIRFLDLTVSSIEEILSKEESTSSVGLAELTPLVLRLLVEIVAFESLNRFSQPSSFQQ